MKLTIRIVCAMLVLIMAISAIACTSDPNETEGTTPGESVGEDTTTEPIDMGYESNVPDDLKFDGQSINMLIYNKTGVVDEFFSEQTGTGDVVSDAVFDRNLAVEENLGIDFIVTPVEDVQNETTLAAKVGGEYQVFSNMTNNTIRSVMAGEVLNLANMDHLDVTKKYWSQGFTDIASFGTDGAQYLVTGAPAITLYRYMYVTIFNKDYFVDAGWEDLYSVVDRGEWTLEYQSNLITDTWDERDGDAKPSEDDFYGFVSGDCVSVDPYLVASGIEIIRKDEDGRWYWDGSVQESVVNMVEAIWKLYYDSNGSYIFVNSAFDDTGLTYIIDKFAAEEAAMATTQLFGVESSIGKIGFKFGVVPMPKMSKEANYQSYVQDQVTSFGVIKSVTSDQYAVIGAFLDELAYQSNKIVVPEYYNRTLSLKFMQDEESREMLNFIYNTIKFDFVGAFSAIISPAVRDQVRVVVASKGSTGVGSTFARWGTNVSRTLDKTVNNKLEALE